MGVIQGQKNEWKRQKKRGVGVRDEETRRKMRQRWFRLFWGGEDIRSMGSVVLHPLPVGAPLAWIQTQE